MAVFPSAHMVFPLLSAALFTALTRCSRQEISYTEEKIGVKKSSEYNTYINKYKFSNNIPIVFRDILLLNYFIYLFVYFFTLEPLFKVAYIFRNIRNHQSASTPDSSGLTLET